MRQIVKTTPQILKLLEEAAEAASGGTSYKSMTYEEGILAALTWLFYGEEEDEGKNPLE